MVDQADGSKSPACSTGDWTFWLGNRFVKSKGTFVMPNNPTSTIGCAALKLRDGYVNTFTDQFNFATFIHSDGTKFSFTKENGLLRTINALDYVPLIFFMNSIPDIKQPICKQIQVRKSKRNRKPTVKMKEFISSQIKCSVPQENKKSLSTRPKSIQSKSSTALFPTIPTDVNDEASIRSDTIETYSATDEQNEESQKLHPIHGF